MNTGADKEKKERKPGTECGRMKLPDKISIKNRKETSHESFCHKNIHNVTVNSEFWEKMPGGMKRSDQKFAANM